VFSNDSFENMTSEMKNENLLNIHTVNKIKKLHNIVSVFILYPIGIAIQVIQVI
jgi:hypothetical protein